MAVYPTIRCLVVALTLSGGSAAIAQQATAPADRCEGTLCDLYYGSAAPAAAPAAQTAPASGATAGVPAGATPLTAPSGGLLGKIFGNGASQQADAAPDAPARRFVSVQGGGLLADRKPKRCSGTLCDLYYGSSAPEEDPAPNQATAEATAVAAMPAPAPVGTPRPRVVIEHEKPVCGVAGADPWKCFR